jgi:ATP-binding cassette subfamily B protein
VLKEFKTLLPMVKKYRWWYVAGLISLIITDAGELLIPQMIKQATNIIASGSFFPAAIATPVLIMIALAAIVALSRFGWRFFLHGASRRIERDLRDKLFAHLLTLSPSFYGTMKTGDIMARATNDMRAIRMATGMALVAFMDGLFLTLAILIILFTTNPALAAITIIPLPLITIIILAFGTVIGQRFKAVQEGFSRLSEHVQETLSGIRVLKSFVRESWAQERFVDTSDAYMQKNMQLVKLWGFFFPLIVFISGLTSLLLMRFGGVAVMLGSFTPGDFVAFLTYLSMLQWPVIGMGMTVNMIQRGAASLGRINMILNEKPDIVSPPRGRTNIDHTGIEIKKLSFSYPDSEIKALDQVDLMLEEGKTLGILGRTGSGKSTLVRILPRLLDPPSGTVFLGGVDIREYDLETLRNAIALVPQDTFLFSASVRENISFARPEADESEIMDAARISTIDREIEKFPKGWETEVGERGLSVSGGQKQRIAISRAILPNPPILIFDDSLSAVDTETEEKILNAFLEHRKGKSNILVSHRVSTLQWADYIVVFDRGRIIQQGSHTQLLATEGLYRNIYLLQQEGSL